MKHFLSIEGPFARAMATFGQLMVVNFLLVITSLPILTIGASQVAGFATLTAMATKQSPPIWRYFWKKFRQNLKQGTLIWGGLALLGYLLVVIWRYVYVTQDYGWWLLGVFIVTLLGLNFGQYIFFYLARFEDNLAKATKNVTIAFILYPFRSILLILWMLLPVLLAAYSPVLLIAVLYTSLFFLVSSIMYIRVKLMLLIFESIKK